MTELIALSRIEHSFASRVQIGVDSNCWYWHGSHRNKQPLFYDTARQEQVYAKRWAYQHWIGELQPYERLMRDVSKCPVGSRYCVNPYHYTKTSTEGDTNARAFLVSKAESAGEQIPDRPSLADAVRELEALEAASPVLALVP